MIQNLLIVKKGEGIPGFVYAKFEIKSEDVEESTVIVTEVNE